MTIKEFARGKGVTAQAVYKRLRLAGVSVESLRDPSTGALTPDGLRILELECSFSSKAVDVNQQPEVYAEQGVVDVNHGAVDVNRTAEVYTEAGAVDVNRTEVDVNCAPVYVNQNPVDVNHDGTVYTEDAQVASGCEAASHARGDHESGGDGILSLEAMRKEVEQLKEQLTEERHRAELAEAREAAAANERDFLRTQLDNAIKASALASVKRIAAAATEDDEQYQRGSVMVEEAEHADTTAQQPAEEPVRKSDQAQTRSFRQRWRDAVMAWKGKA